VDLLGILLNLAVVSVSVCLVLIINSDNCKLLAVKVKWTKKGCPTQDKREEMYNGHKQPKYGEESKLSWLIGDKRENMGLRCRLSRVASILGFLVAALQLLTLAFGSFVKRKSDPPAAKICRPLKTSPQCQI
jgi:hypothetical protein